MNNKDELTSTSVTNLLKTYRDKMEQRETMWKKAQENEIERLKQNQTNCLDDYKAKWENAEAQCRQWEKKFEDLENETIKPLKAKIDQLESDYHQMKIIRDRVEEICSCRQLTNIHFEQLKSLVNGTNSSTTQFETIANKNDFHQQTLKLREIFNKQNEDLLKKIEELISRKRKRNQSDDESSDEDQQ